MFLKYVFHFFFLFICVYLFCQINYLFTFFSFQPCYGLIDLYGQCEEISIVRTHNQTQNFRENDTIPELADATTNSILEQDEKDSNPGAPGVLSSSTIIIPQIITTSNPIILRSSNQPLIMNSVSGVLTGGANSAVFSSKQCDYFKLCSQFKSSLALPTHFFQEQKCGTCHCHQCIKVRGDELYVKKGDPPKDFALPLHWTRFPLKPTGTGNTESWHTAYHGTKSSSLRKILDHG